MTELAMYYAVMVKSGVLGRHSAYQQMNSHIGNFGESVLAIDIAIGEINAGKEY